MVVPTPTSKREKTEMNRKRKMSMDDNGEEDEESRDWWTKYFASVEAMIEVVETLIYLLNKYASLV